MTRQAPIEAGCQSPITSWPPRGGPERWSTTGNRRQAPPNKRRDMADAISVSGPISGTERTLSFEAGKLAQLADGAVVARIGDTPFLATAQKSRSVREGQDFFPLAVDIDDRAYAAGKIPGAFLRREGRRADQAIPARRLIDRPLCPSFHR